MTDRELYIILLSLYSYSEYLENILGGCEQNGEPLSPDYAKVLDDITGLLTELEPLRTKLETVYMSLTEEE